MISSLMPVFSARVALCSTWLAGAKRFSKNSISVGLVGHRRQLRHLAVVGRALRAEQAARAAPDGRVGRRRDDLRFAADDQAAGGSSSSLSIM